MSRHFVAVGEALIPTEWIKREIDHDRAYSYSRIKREWIGRNPRATPEEIEAVSKAIAEQVGL